MALITAPYGGGTLIGSIGSTTFQRNRYGNLARQRVSPVNPNTLRQVNTRAALAYLSGLWGTGLTQSERDNWNAYAASTPWFPHLKFITGQAAFIAVNWVPVYVDGPGTENVTAPPTPLMSAHNILTITASAAGGTVVLNLINPAGNGNDTWLVEVSQVLGPGKYFWKGPFQFQTSFTGAVALPFMLKDFGVAQTAGTKIWVKSRKYSGDENKVSPVQIQPLIFS